MTEPAWQRLHPLTPLLRGGRFLLAAAAVVGQQGLREASLRTLLLGLAAVVPIGLVVGLVSWRTTRYRLDAGELQIDSGVLQRRSRRVPLARLQSVDVVRPLVARVLGLAELRLEVAGGGATEAPLSYLSEPDAGRLRVLLLGRASGAAGADAAALDGPAGQVGQVGPLRSPADDEQVLVAVPTGVLVASVLLAGPTLLLATVLLALAVVAVVDLGRALALSAVLVPLLLGIGGFLTRRLLGEYGFTVAESADGLRLRHGLLDTRAQTIPYGRVQAVRVREPLLWRRSGWVRAEVDVAGYSGNDREQTSTTSALLPVAPREFALALVDRVLGAPRPPLGPPPPPSARWRAPLQSRRLRVGLDDRLVVTTQGVLSPRTEIVPLAKVQSLRLVQGPWQRRLGLATVRVDCAGRTLPFLSARHRGEGEAAALLEELTVRARRARRPAP